MIRDRHSMQSSILLAMLLAVTTCAWSAQKYSAAGLVLRVDPSHRTILLSCESIPGHMEAATWFRPYCTRIHPQNNPRQSLSPQPNHRGHIHDIPVP